MSRVRRTVPAAAVALVGMSLLAGPAWAGPPPEISYSSPSTDPKTPVPSREVGVGVTVRSDGGVLVDSIRRKVTACRPDCERVVFQESVPANGGSSQDVSFGFSLAPTEFNGKYQATVTATAQYATTLVPFEPEHDETQSQNRVFYVAAPPVPPTGLKAAVNGDTRVVTLTWSPNPEPDLLFYQVQRPKLDGTIEAVGEPVKAGSPLSLEDQSTTAAGGEYRYQVVAVRQGAVKGQGVSSEPSATSVNVPAPPGAPPGAQAGGAAGGAAPGSTVPGAAGKPQSAAPVVGAGKIDLSGFGTLVKKAQASQPRPTEADPGFKETLPFPEQGGSAEVAEQPADNPQVRELGAEETSTNRLRSMSFLAGGLLATVLLMHLLWVKAEVNREPLEALVPGDRAPVDDEG